MTVLEDYLNDQVAEGHYDLLANLAIFKLFAVLAFACTTSCLCLELDEQIPIQSRPGTESS